MEILLTNYSVILITISLIIRLFRKGKNFSYFTYACALGVALGQNYIEPIGFTYLLVITLVLLVSCSKKIDNLIKIASFIFILIFGYNLISHKLPGFNNLQLIYEQFSPESTYYSLWLNYDTIFFATAIFLTQYENISLKKFLQAWGIGVLFAIVSVIILGGLATWYELISLDIFISDIFWLWIWIAALYALFEEVFFRMYIINHLTSFNPQSKSLLFFAVIFSTFLFAYKHFWGGVIYVGIAAVAGFLYAGSYIVSGRRIEASFITHFSVNLMHMVFFTYPFLNK